MTIEIQLNDEDDPRYVVYVIQAGEGAVKIGVAKNAWVRMATLQTGNAVPLSLIYYLTCPAMKVAYRIERTLHKRYARYRLSGEWFNVTPKRVLKDIGFVRALSPYLDGVTVTVPDDEEAPEGLPCKPELRVSPFASQRVSVDRTRLPGSPALSPPGARYSRLPIANPFKETSNAQSATPESGTERKESNDGT